jgi:muconolactone delta-isomerase
MRFKPRIIGSLIAVVGFLVARLTAQPISLPSEVVAYLQAEQKQKLRALTAGLFRGNWRFRD